MDIIGKYNQAATQYAKSLTGKEDLGQLRKFGELLEPGAKVLDIGCAAGRDTRVLKDMGFRAIGADMAERLLEIARQANPDIEFVQADIRKLPFDDKSFEGVWASAVLHHVEKSEMPEALEEFSRVLTSHGPLYIHTKAGSGQLKTNEATVLGKTREFELVTAQELDEMLNKTGFQKISLRTRASKTREGLFWVSAFYRKASEPSQPAAGSSR